MLIHLQAGLRNKPSYNPTHYSIEWTNVMTSYMKKQLAEIKLPSAPRPGLNIKQTFKGVLADFDSRERWVSRFAYWFATSLLQYTVQALTLWKPSTTQSLLPRRSC